MLSVALSMPIISAENRRISHASTVQKQCSNGAEPMHKAIVEAD